MAVKREIEAAFGWAVARPLEGAAPAAGSASAAAAAAPVSGLLHGVTAYELLQREQASPVRGIPTFCRELDNMLGGGVQLGTVTEFCACVL